MSHIISMGDAGCINYQRVILVANLSSAPIKRFVKETDPANLVNLTFGYPQRSVIVFDNGIVAITRYPVNELEFAIRTGTELESDGLPF